MLTTREKISGVSVVVSLTDSEIVPAKLASAPGWTSRPTVNAAAIAIMVLMTKAKVLPLDGRRQ